MFNGAVLRAWPNWVLIPLMLAFWVMIYTLGAELLGAAPSHTESAQQ